MPLVDVVAHGLADEVVADREHLEAVLGEQVAAPLRVAVLLERALDVEVVTPARELEAVEAELLRLLGDGLEGQIGPLAGEQGDRSRH